MKEESFMLEIQGFNEFTLNLRYVVHGDANMLLLNFYIKQFMSDETYNNSPFASIVIKDYPDWSEEFLDYLESEEIYNHPGDLFQFFEELIESCGVTIVKKGTDKYNYINEFLKEEYPSMHDAIIYINYSYHDDLDKKISHGNHDILIMATTIYDNGILQPIQKSQNFCLHDMVYIMSENNRLGKNNKVFIYADIYSAFHYDVAVQEEEDSIKFIRNTIGVTSDFRYSVISNPEKLFQHKQFVTDVNVSWLPYQGREHLLTIEDINVPE